MMDAVVADNSWVVKEVRDKMEQELDLWSIGGEGFGLSRDIDHKIDMLCLDSPPEVRPSAPCPQAPNDEEGSPVFETCDVKEEIVITFDERTPTAMANRSRVTETRRQLKRRKLTIGFHHG